MIHLFHPSGNTFVRALLEVLEGSGSEYRFWTTIASSPGGLLSSVLPKRFRAQLKRRCFDVPMERVETRPLREWARLLSSAIGFKGLTRHESGWASVDAVYRDLDRLVAGHLRSSQREPPAGSWVYGYEDGALECFRAAKQIGMQRAYELPIAYWETSRRLLGEESERLPEWAATLVGPADSEAKLERKTHELELADLIVVPSRFVQRSLPSWLKPEQQVVVAEFGSPEISEIGNRDWKIGIEPKHRGRLRVLFAGSMTQRKGLADVFEAMRRLDRSDVELVIMGSPVVPMIFYLQQGVEFTYEASRPHSEVLELMTTCDVLLLPSIVEGRALVQQEALACGLPLLVTAHAGGEDLVVEGETGFLLPIRQPLAIVERLSWLADHRETLERMRPFCRAKAAEYTWKRYADTILNALHLTPVPSSPVVQ
jgi:glycosyltransferase involved in cell wall biosynthesis